MSGPWNGCSFSFPLAIVPDNSRHALVSLRREGRVISDLAEVGILEWEWQSALHSVRSAVCYSRLRLSNLNCEECRSVHGCAKPVRSFHENRIVLVRGIYQYLREL